MSDYIRMSEAGGIIASVTSWYEKNRGRPVENKTKPEEEQQLARSWLALLNRKSKLPADVRAEAEKLKARWETKAGQTVAGPVDRLVEWMEEYKRRPRRKRDGVEDKLALLTISMVPRTPLILLHPFNQAANRISHGLPSLCLQSRFELLGFGADISGQRRFTC